MGRSYTRRSRAVGCRRSFGLKTSRLCSQPYFISTRGSCQRLLCPCQQYLMKRSKTEPRTRLPRLRAQGDAAEAGYPSARIFCEIPGPSSGIRIATSSRFSRTSNRPMKKGCAEGQSPFAGGLRVSLRYKFIPFSAQKGVRGSSRGFFNTLLNRYSEHRDRMGRARCGTGIIVEP